MVMHMIVAGGIPASAGANPRSLEQSSPWEAARSITPGHVTKVLDPISSPTAIGHLEDARIVWLDRNLTQQVRSFRKFTAALGMPIGTAQAKRLRNDWRRDRQPSIDKLTRLGSVLVVRFEDVLQHPAVEALRIADHVTAGDPYRLDLHAMANAVHRRHSNCRADLSFELGEAGA